ncbi:MAG: SIR2 family NAD-dependent protein deacylase [Acidimicrobiales bacterium]
MADSLNEDFMDVLVRRASNSKCTPFIGAGVSPHRKGSEIAVDWADQLKYPMDDKSDLTSVAEFVALKFNRGEPIERILEEFTKTPLPDFTDPGENHRVLADLGLPIYLTTNYDPFMTDALTAAGRSPKRLISDWNGSAAEHNAQQMGVRSMKKWPDPTVEEPWVFHLHGADAVQESIVITEDDYLDFLARLQMDVERMLPYQVRTAISQTSLLFTGYSLVDWTFRVLFRGIQLSLPEFGRGMNAHFALQLPRHSEEQDYLTRYFDRPELKVKVFWGDKDEFFHDLRNKWDARKVSA